MMIFGENLFAQVETRLTFNSYSCSVSRDPHEMSLNIDIKMIRPVNYSGFSLILTWTPGLCCGPAMWWILGKYSTRIPLAHHQLCPKLCITKNFWTTWTCLVRQYLILCSHSSFQGIITQNLRIRRLLWAGNWWFLHRRPKIIVSMKNLPSWLESLHKFHLIVRLSTFQIWQTSVSLRDCSLYFWWSVKFEQFFPMNTDACNVEDINIPQIKERLSMSCVESSEDWSNIFRTQSFTLCKNDLVFNDMSDSATMSESMSSSSTINLSDCCVNKRMVVHKQVSPFSLPSLHQISTLGKTIFRQYSILSSLMSRRPQQVLPFLDAAQSTSSEVFDFHIWFSQDFLMQ